jgi:hypothetical protein
MGTPDSLSERLAQAQLDVVAQAFGDAPFTTAQACAAGLSRGQLNRLIEKGLLEAILYGVYRRSRGPLDLADRARAVALMLPSGSAVVRRTAAWLLGVDARPPAERGVPMEVECAVPLGATPIRRAHVRCYQTELEPSDLSDHHGLPTTTPTRTSADLLRWDGRPMGFAVADALAATGVIEPAEVLELLVRWPGHRFVRQARQLASWLEPLTESFGESWLRLRILEAGFPRPTAQIPIFDHRGRCVYRLDLGWPELRIGIEYDGDEFHSGQDALRADRFRRRRLGADFGWQVTGVGRGEVLGRGLELERGIGELLGLAPTIIRRTW